MKYNRCGKSGLLLPQISLGLWHNFGSVDNFDTAECIAVEAFDKGVLLRLARLNVLKRDDYALVRRDVDACDLLGRDDLEAEDVEQRDEADERRPLATERPP